MDHLGVDIRPPIFGHGQLYVAMCRAIDAYSKITVLADESSERVARNVVYQEVLDKVMPNRNFEQ